jgi:hypothetical protein
VKAGQNYTHQCQPLLNTGYDDNMSAALDKNKTMVYSDNRLKTNQYNLTAILRFKLL